MASALGSGRVHWAGYEPRRAHRTPESRSAVPFRTSDAVPERVACLPKLRRRRVSATGPVGRGWLSLDSSCSGASTNTNMKTTSMQIQKWVFLGTLFTLQLSTSTFAAVEIGTVQTSTVGHAFLNPNLLLPPGPPTRPS